MALTGRLVPMSRSPVELYSTTVLCTAVGNSYSCSSTCSAATDNQSTRCLLPSLVGVRQGGGRQGEPSSWYALRTRAAPPAWRRAARAGASPTRPRACPFLRVRPFFLPCSRLAALPPKLAVASSYLSLVHALLHIVGCVRLTCRLPRRPLRSDLFGQPWQ